MALSFVSARRRQTCTAEALFGGSSPACVGCEESSFAAGVLVICCRSPPLPTLQACYLLVEPTALEEKEKGLF